MAATKKSTKRPFEVRRSKIQGRGVFATRDIKKGEEIVEYKGEHLYTDAEEKRLAGQAWESRSGGRCLFIMLTRRDFSDITAKIREGQAIVGDFRLTG